MDCPAGQPEFNFSVVMNRARTLPQAITVFTKSNVGLLITHSFIVFRVSMASSSGR